MSDGGGRDRFLTEILEQPDALRRAGAALVAQRDRLDHLAAFAASPGPIVLTGMGGSLDACHAAATALAAAGIMATVRGASELVHFGLPALAQGGILVVVSQSGESAEIVRLAEAVRHTTGRPIVVAVANGADNPLVRLADIPIDTRAGEELAPSTKSFAACLVSLSGIVRALAAGRGAAGGTGVAEGATGDAGGGTDEGRGGAIGEVTARDAEAAADAIAALLAEPEAMADGLAGLLGGRDWFVALGRGAALAGAKMGALLLAEAVGLAAASHETGDFRHGPLELAGPGLAVALLALEDATLDLDLALADELAGAGSPLLVVSRDGVGPAEAIRVATGPLDRMVAPAVALVPLQLLAWRLAVRAGRTPGEMLRGSKVTRRE